MLFIPCLTWIALNYSIAMFIMGRTIVVAFFRFDSTMTTTRLFLYQNIAYHLSQFLLIGQEQFVFRHK